jgi:hypothetical protein
MAEGVVVDASEPALEYASRDSDLPTSGDAWPPRAPAEPSPEEERRPAPRGPTHQRQSGAGVTGARPAGPPDEAGDVHVSATGWTATAGMGRRRWVEYGRRIARAGSGTNWWLGDWLRFGNREYGDKYSLASRITGYDEQTLMNYVYVSSHVALPERRADVSWSHHAELAKLSQGERSRWLQRVSDQSLSVADLRSELRAARAVLARESASAPPDPPQAPVCPACGQPVREP